MEKKYSVVITPQAQQHITEIRDYILLELKSPTAAKNTLSALKTSIGSLEQMPGRIPLVREEKWREYGIHTMSVKNFLIYFTIDEEDLTVYVIAVLYARRDQKNVLEEII